MEQKLARRDKRIFELENQTRCLKAKIVEMKRTNGEHRKLVNLPKLDRPNSDLTNFVESAVVGKKNRTNTVKPVKNRTTVEVVKYPGWLTNEKRTRLEKKGYSFLIDSGDLLCVNAIGQRDILFKSLDLDHLLEMVCPQQINSSIEGNKTTGTAYPHITKPADTVKPWILEKGKKTIRNRYTDDAYPLSSLRYVDTPTPGYEDTSLRVWIRMCDIEEEI